MNQFALLPPQNVETEKVILGILMREQGAVNKVMDILTEDSFYSPIHTEIWKTIRELTAKDSAIDVLTVFHAIVKKKKESAELNRDYLINLSTLMVGSANLETYARQVEEMAVARRVLQTMNEITQNIYQQSGEDIQEILARLDLKLFNARRSISSYKNVTSAYIGDKALKSIRDAMDGKFSGIPTGVRELDEIIGGWVKGNLNLIGARTRQGKSAVAAAFMYYAAKHLQEASVFFSLEMSQEELFYRMASMHLRDEFKTKIPYSRIAKGKISEAEWEDVQQAIKDLQNMNLIFIDDSPSLTPLLIKTKIMKYKIDYGITHAYVDYVQLMDHQAGNKTTADAIGLTMAGLKNTAKAMEMPIIALSQINRDLEKRPGTSYKPKLSDLKGSGGLEEATDVVLLLDRPEVNGIMEDEMGRSNQGILNIEVAKQKMGETGNVRIRFDVATNYFEPEDFFSPFN